MLLYVWYKAALRLLAVFCIMTNTSVWVVVVYGVSFMVW